VSSITASGNVAAPGRPVLLSTISAARMSAMCTCLRLSRPARRIRSMWPTWTIWKAVTPAQSMGILPDVGEGAFTMEFEWEPLMFAISDGTRRSTQFSCRRALGPQPRKPCMRWTHLPLPMAASRAMLGCTLATGRCGRWWALPAQTRQAHRTRYSEHRGYLHHSDKWMDSARAAEPPRWPRKREAP